MTACHNWIKMPALNLNHRAIHKTFYPKFKRKLITFVAESIIPELLHDPVQPTMKDFSVSWFEFRVTGKSSDELMITT